MNFQKINVASLILRLGLAFVFFFAAATAFLSPVSYYKYVPTFVTQFMPVNTFLFLYGIFEVVLAMWLLIGKWAFFSGMISVILLFAVTIFNLGEINILFRNVAIICAALALVALSKD